MKISLLWYHFTMNSMHKDFQSEIRFYTKNMNSATYIC